MCLDSWVPLFAARTISVVVCSRPSFVPFEVFGCGSAASALLPSCSSDGVCRLHGPVTQPMLLVNVRMPGCSSCHVIGILQGFLGPKKQIPCTAPFMEGAAIPYQNGHHTTSQGSDITPAWFLGSQHTLACGEAVVIHGVLQLGFDHCLK